MIGALLIRCPYSSFFVDMYEWHIICIGALTYMVGTGHSDRPVFAAHTSDKKLFQL